MFTGQQPAALARAAHVSWSAAGITKGPRLGMRASGRRKGDSRPSPRMAAHPAQAPPKWLAARTPTRAAPFQPQRFQPNTFTREYLAKLSDKVARRHKQSALSNHHLCRRSYNLSVS
jgi:hypothetical protein